MYTIDEINGMKLPVQPLADNGYSVITSDIDSEQTGRSAETGVLLRYPIRQGVYKLQLSFRGRNSDIRKIKDMIAPAKLTVKFYDLDRWVTKEMYVGDRSQSLLPVPGQTGWSDFSFNLVEY